MRAPRAWYNENDKYAAAWLRNLIAAGHIAAGDVDERSIVDVQAADLEGYTQCHFFAGIGGWSLAARLAGIPDDEPLWTGSCPCQPFSGAGLQLGTADHRHLWPDFRRLIEKCAPPVVVGEQVASKLGREWLAGVRADLEGLDYAVGAADLCAAGTGAPHIRQRLYWLADASSPGRGTLLGAGETNGRPEVQSDRHRDAGRMADADGGRQPKLTQRDGGAFGRLEPSRRDDAGGRGAVGGLGNTCSAGSGRDARAVSGAQGKSQGERLEPRRIADQLVAAGTAGRMGDADDARSQGWLDGSGEGGRADQRIARSSGQSSFDVWQQYDIVHCTDGKARRFEPGSFPLAHGATQRVGRLRAYGNAIVPPLAARFLAAAFDTLQELDE